MKFNLVSLMLSFITLATVTVTTIKDAVAEETLATKAKEAGNDTRRSVKNSVRSVQDKTCELVNGKMDCAIQKTKHSIQKGADTVEDAVD